MDDRQTDIEAAGCWKIVRWRPYDPAGEGAVTAYITAYRAYCCVNYECVYNYTWVGGWVDGCRGRVG